MKKIYSLVILVATLLLSGCDQRNTIDVSDINSVPDLSNPVVQKLTNTMWYKSANINYNNFIWNTVRFQAKTSAAMEGILYTTAWVGMELRRDGTSTLLFKPPFNKYSYVTCQGRWAVSTTDENTVVLDSKTPVGYVNMKIKVRDIQAKDNVSTVATYVDLGDKMMVVDFMNSSSYYDDDTNGELPDFKNVVSSWFETMPVSTAQLSADEFANTAWSMSSYKDEIKDLLENPAQCAIRTTYVNDLLTKTPALLFGAQFAFGADGTAYIDVPSYIKASAFFSFQEQLGEQQIVARGKWRIYGNKIIVETNELPAISMAEAMFSLKIQNPQTEFLPIKQEGQGVKVWKNYFDVIEVIKRTAKGMWVRISSEQETHYLFLLKQDMPDETKTWGVREAVKKLN